MIYVTGEDGHGMIVNSTSSIGGRPVGGGSGPVASYEAPLDMLADFELPMLGFTGTEKSGLKRSIEDLTRIFDETSMIDTIRPSAYNEFRRTTLWRDSYNCDNPDHLNLGLEPMSATIGAKVTKKPVDGLMMIARANVELFISLKLDADSLSTSSPIGDELGLKFDRQINSDEQRKSLFSIMTVAGVPDIVGNLVRNKDLPRIGDFIDLTESPEAATFRNWFHAQEGISPQEMRERYIYLLHHGSFMERDHVKSLKLGLIEIAGFVPFLDKALGLYDRFVLDRIVAGRSPKAFMNNVRTFAGLYKTSTTRLGR